MNTNYLTLTRISSQNRHEKRKRFYPFLKVAGVQGFEPQSADPESAVLPLNDTPSRFNGAMIPQVLPLVKRLSPAKMESLDALGDWLLEVAIRAYNNYRKLFKTLYIVLLKGYLHAK